MGRYMIASDIGQGDDFSVISVISIKDGRIKIVHTAKIDTVGKDTKTRQKEVRIQTTALKGLFPSTQYSMDKKPNLTIRNWVKGVGASCPVCFNLNDPYNNYRYHPEFDPASNLLSLTCLQCKSKFIREGDYLILEDLYFKR